MWLLARCPDLTELGLHTRVRAALGQVLETAPPTYDLAGGAEPAIQMEEFNERMLHTLDAAP